jgi:NAD-dependent SIR2 family protein deacetylase
MIQKINMKAIKVRGRKMFLLLRGCFWQHACVAVFSFPDLVSRGIMKPDIVFFGEGLPEIFHDSMAKDKDECDLLIVIGSSLKVRPVALIPSEYTSFIFGMVS